jgi:hypothetical protein
MLCREGFEVVSVVGAGEGDAEKGECGKEA